jgi:hypothetical protein
MNTTTAWEITQAILISIGGGGLLIFSLSSYLGKIWADRLMATETAKYQEKLEILRSELSRTGNRDALNHKEKIDLYKGISEPIIGLIVSIEHTGNITYELLSGFEHRRLSITAQLAMFAPMSVYDTYNELIEYLYNCMEVKDSYSFKKFREYAHKFLTEARKDVGIHTDEVRYLGNR